MRRSARLILPLLLILPAHADALTAGPSSPVGAPVADAEPRSAPSPAETVLVTGTVRAKDTGRPLPAATVRVLAAGAEAAWTARTGSGGRYRLRLGRASVGRELRLVASHRGYASQTRSVPVRGATVRVDFELGPRATRQEQLEDASAVPGLRLAPMSREGRRYGAAAGPPGSHYPPGFNTESYDRIEESGFVSPRLHPLSTFSADVDRAAYANVRRFLTGGRLPPVDAVRIEELVNYFSYGDPLPADDEESSPFAVRTETAPAPWRPAHRLVRIALRTPAVGISELPPSHLVFLVDVSGSMGSPNKLPLLKRSLRMLVERLRARDRVSLVVYAGAAGVVLEGAAGDEKERILAALEELESGGSTAGGEGLRLAYRLASRHRMEEGNDRVILATDGDFNVGVSSDAAMRRLVEEEREGGTFLTVLGFGAGNTKFSKMEKMADHGNGQFHYIDSVLEARKALVGEMGGTLLTVAKDVKLQVQFDPRAVRGYRLIGYENRRLAPEDFRDDEKDAGDVGAGHSVVAFYEVVPHGVDTGVDVFAPDSLRYQRPRPTARSGDDRDEIGWLAVRYKEPDGERSRALEFPIHDAGTEPSRAFRFGAAVVEFGLLLRESPYRGDARFDRSLARARAARGADPRGYRAEFLRLVQTARELGPRGPAGEAPGAPTP